MTNARANKKRSVSFNDEVRCIRSLHINNYTDKEIVNTWFTKEEYKEIKREMKITVEMMDKKSDFAEGINFSSRGLEDRTAALIVQKVEHRYFAMGAVLDEQDRQREVGIHDPIELSLVYMQYSFVSHMAAFLMAATDEKIALGYGITSGSTNSCTPSSRQSKGSLTPPSKAHSKVYRVSASPRLSGAA